MDSSTGQVTVVLVNYRSLENIGERLSSVALQGQNVIVVDNNDDPEGVAALCKLHGAIPLLLDENKGFAAGVNAAVTSVQQPDRPWLLLNPDASIENRALKGLLNELDGHDGVAPALVNGAGQLQIGAGGGPLTFRSVLYFFLFLAHLIPRLRGVFLTRRQSRTAREVDWLCMACLLLAPDVFQRFGPIPEDEVVYAEDVAWGTEATLSGARFRLCPHITVRHDQGGSGASEAWIGALERLCRRRLGRIRGGFAVTAIRVGLSVRRGLGRSVT
jgi:N-acetylglucosaminyl-diphospho-decaprenol L-rhamnosyltransferase